MKRLKLFLFVFLIVASKISIGQFDTSKRRKITLHSTVLTGAITSQYGLYHLWYKDYQIKNFHVFNDSREWGYMDKLGHTFSSFQIANNLDRYYRWAGHSKKTSLTYSSLVSFLYLFNIEIMDGFSEGWGFSFTDLASNSAGIGLFYLQNRLLKTQLIYPKFSYSPTIFADYRPSVLGSNSISRIFKDYNGQTYWLSIKMNSISQTLPSWLLFSIGYSINERLVGGSTYFETDDINFRSYPQYLFSLDIDLGSIKTRNKVLSFLFKKFNLLKIPFPTVSIEKDRVLFYPIYF